jgi:adenylate kinase family enzyme
MVGRPSKIIASNTSISLHRFVVIGTTGSGKSTLAKRLAAKLDLEFIELDALHWLPDWKHVSDEEFRNRVEHATRADGWVIAGNYGIVRDISWPRAQAVIWLDYPLWTIFWQLWRRTWSRWWTQELLWGTNYERLIRQFKIWSAEDSLFHWLFKTYWRRKREYPRLLELPEYSHLIVFQFRTPLETELWFSSLTA